MLAMAERITQLIRAATGGDKPARGRLTRWAEDVGTTPSTVTRWRGGTIPDAEWWPALARVLNVTETEIAAASDQPSTGPTIADLDRKLDRILELLAGKLEILAGKGRPKIEAGDGTPTEMPRPVLKGRGR